MDTNRFAALPDEELLKQRLVLNAGLDLSFISIMVFLSTVIHSVQLTDLRAVRVSILVSIFIPVGINLYNLSEIKKEIKARGLE